MVIGFRAFLLTCSQEVVKRVKYGRAHILPYRIYWGPEEGFTL